LKSFGLTLLALSFLAGGTALADNIPYSNTGAVPPQTSLVATSTTITGYFYSASAGDNDEVRLIDLTELAAYGGILNSTDSSTWVLPNHGAGVTEGTSTNFPAATVHVGDQLLFELLNTTTNQVFATNSAYSSDGANHGYITTFSGDSKDPAGMYIGFEDLPVPGSDLDYNDEAIVITGAASPTPEPSSLVLLGTTLLGVAVGLRRRLKLS
jgi:hypothetical protein